MNPQKFLEELDRERLLCAVDFLLKVLLNQEFYDSSNIATHSDSESEYNKTQIPMEVMYEMENQTKTGELLTPAQAAELIGTITPRTVVKWGQQGLLPCVKINRHWYFYKTEVLKILRFYDKSGGQQ